MAKDFSEAFLTLAENGALKTLEEKWLTPSKECSNGSTSPETESLTLHNFWGLYIICAAISTICFVMALLKNHLNKHNHIEEEDQHQDRATADDDSVWKKALRIGTGFYNNVNNKTLGRAATFGGMQLTRRRNSSRWQSISTSDDVANPQSSQSAVKDML